MSIYVKTAPGVKIPESTPYLTAGKVYKGSMNLDQGTNYCFIKDDSGDWIPVNTDDECAFIECSGWVFCDKDGNVLEDQL